MKVKNVLYGYCRISTMKQKLERQIENIKREYPEAVIISEAYTGTKVDRPKWSNLYKHLKTGDTVVFDEVSRMARNAEEGTALYFELYDKGINLVFLKQHHIDTEAYKEALAAVGIQIDTDSSAEGVLISDIVNALNKFMRAKIKADIYKAFEQAEDEVNHLHQRTSEGVRRAQAEGKQVGRATGTKVETKKAKEMKVKIKKLSKDFDGAMTDVEVMEVLKIARNTYYKYKKALSEA